MTVDRQVKIYIVGGYVRDRLLGREGKDHDYVVVGADHEWMINAGFKQVGADFPVYLHHESGDEYALARKERKVAAGYHGFETEVDSSVTLEDDLCRRDLTINAMAREVISWNELGHAKLKDEIIDPFNGQEDLKNGIIRHVSEAFAEDPVRVLRAARFAARYNFRIADETYDLMKWLVRDGELDHLTTERVWLEFEKTMKDSNSTHDFLTILNTVGALDVLMPEIVNEVPYLRVPLKAADMTDAPVAAKCAMITSLMMNKHVVEDFWRRMKAPNDVIWLATTSNAVRLTVERAWKGTPEQILSTLKTMNAYKDMSGFIDVLLVLTSTNEFWEEATILSTAQHITKDISFDDLSKEQQTTLKGKEIGEAIDALRVQKIKQYLDTKDFLSGTS